MKNNNWVPSQYQEKIYNWVDFETGNGIVNAVAGAGKTTTLVEVAKKISIIDSAFIAFNKHIVTTLRRKLPNQFNCKTIHSIGFNVVAKHLGGNIEVSEFKYGNLANNVVQRVKSQLDAQYEEKYQIWLQSIAKNLEEAPPEPKRSPSFEEIKGQFVKLIDLSRNTLTNLSDSKEVEVLMVHFGIDEHVSLDIVLPLVNNILEEGISQAESNCVIDYVDMIFLPNYWSLKVPKSGWILVDEAQDLNIAQLSLILKMKKANTRMLFVGDPRQAIYGFAGADVESFKNIQRNTDAKELELSICYRCPRKVVELAKQIVPSISCADSAIEGEIINISEEQLVKHVQEGDLVLCRSTEPLVRNCIHLISNRISAAVRGRDIGKHLITIIQEVKNSKGFSFKNFTYYLNQYSKDRLEKLSKKQNSERKIIEFKDQILSIETCYQRFSVSSVYELCREIENLFSDNRSSVTLSTIHRAKGLEENRVFILNYEKLPLTWQGQHDWQFTQEENLKYVAITRAKKELFLISETPTSVDIKKIESSRFDFPDDLEIF